MGVIRKRCAEMIGADERADASEGFGEAVRVAQTGIEEARLAHEWTGGRGVERERRNGRCGLE